MLEHRVIPCLLLEKTRLVKTQKFKNPVYVGDPINAVKVFNDKEVDELVLLDIDVSRRGEPPDFEFIEKLASEAFMPLSYGGGVRTVNQARQLFHLGVEKVIIKTAAITDYKFLQELSLEFGSSSLVVSVDVKSDYRRNVVPVDGRLKKLKTHSLPELLNLYENCGVGEILLQNVDCDGTMAGPDLEIVRQIGKRSVPLTVAGGVSSLSDIKNLIDAGADAVGAGAFFTFYGPHRAVLLTYPNYQELSDLLKE